MTGKLSGLIGWVEYWTDSNCNLISVLCMNYFAFIDKSLIKKCLPKYFSWKESQGWQKTRVLPQGEICYCMAFLSSIKRFSSFWKGWGAYCVFIITMKCKSKNQTLHDLFHPDFHHFVLVFLYKNKEIKESQQLNKSKLNIHAYLLIYVYLVKLVQ